MFGLDYLKQAYDASATPVVVDTEDPEATAALAELCDETVWDPDPAEVEALVQRGANVFEATFSDIWDICPIFHFLIYNGRVEAVKACLRSPLPMDFTTTAFRDRTPLHILCLENISDADTREMLCAIVRRLETHPEDRVQWNQTNNTGYHMLSCAARYQKLSLVWPLVRHMPYFQCDCFDFIALPVVWRWDWDALDEEEQMYFSLENAEMVEASRPTAELVKLIWQFRLHPDLVEQQVQAGADVLFRDAVYKACMLHYCLKWAAVDCLRACLRTPRPIDFTQTDRYGYTPLHYTVMAVQKAPHLAEELLGAMLDRMESHHETDKVDWDAKDLFGRDVLSFAAHSHVLSLVWPILKRRRVARYFPTEVGAAFAVFSAEKAAAGSASADNPSNNGEVVHEESEELSSPLSSMLWLTCDITASEWWALDQEDRDRLVPPNRPRLLELPPPPVLSDASASSYGNENDDADTANRVPPPPAPSSGAGKTSMSTSPAAAAAAATTNTTHPMGDPRKRTETRRGAKHCLEPLLPRTPPPPPASDTKTACSLDEAAPASANPTEAEHHDSGPHVTNEPSQHPSHFAGGLGFLHRMVEQYEALASPTMLSPSAGLRAFFFPLSVTSSATKSFDEVNRHHDNGGVHRHHQENSPCSDEEKREKGEKENEIVGGGQNTERHTTTTTVGAGNAPANDKPSPSSPSTASTSITTSSNSSSHNNNNNNNNNNNTSSTSTSSGWRSISKVLSFPPKMVGRLRHGASTGLSAGAARCKKWFTSTRDRGDGGDGLRSTPLQKEPLSPQRGGGEDKAGQKGRVEEGVAKEPPQKLKSAMTVSVVTSSSSTAAAAATAEDPERSVEEGGQNRVFFGANRIKPTGSASCSPFTANNSSSSSASFLAAVPLTPSAAPVEQPGSTTTNTSTAEN